MISLSLPAQLHARSVLEPAGDFLRPTRTAPRDHPPGGGGQARCRRNSPTPAPPSRSRRSTTREKDPWQIHNLADDPALRPVLERMRKALRDWQTETRDLGFIHEWQAEKLCDSRRPLSESAHATRLASTSSECSTPRAVSAARDSSRNSSSGSRCRSHRALLGGVGLRVAGREAAGAQGRVAQGAGRRALPVRVEAAGTLVAQTADRAALEQLVDILASDDEHAVLHAARTLQLLGEKSRPALPALQATLPRIPEMFARWAVTGAINGLTGIDQPVLKPQAAGDFAEEDTPLTVLNCDGLKQCPPRCGFAVLTGACLLNGIRSIPAGRGSPLLRFREGRRRQSLVDGQDGKTHRGSCMPTAGTGTSTAGGRSPSRSSANTAFAPCRLQGVSRPLSTHCCRSLSMLLATPGSVGLQTDLDPHDLLAAGSVGLPQLDVRCSPPAGHPAGKETEPHAPRRRRTLTIRHRLRRPQGLAVQAGLQACLGHAVARGQARDGPDLSGRGLGPDVDPETAPGTRLGGQLGAAGKARRHGVPIAHRMPARGAQHRLRGQAVTQQPRVLAGGSPAASRCPSN